MLCWEIAVECKLCDLGHVYIVLLGLLGSPLGLAEKKAEEMSIMQVKTDATSNFQQADNLESQRRIKSPWVLY